MGNFDTGFRWETVLKSDTPVPYQGDKSQTNPSDKLYGTVGQMFQQGTTAVNKGVEAGGTAMGATAQSDLATRLAISEARTAANSAMMSQNDMRQAAQRIAGSAGNLDPFIGGLQGSAGQLTGDAQTMRGTASDLLSVQSDLLSGDPNAGGLAGAWNKFLATLSPDMYVSQARRSTQGEIDSQQDQLVRQMSRMGMPSNSQAMAAVLQKGKRYAEALMAGATTRARQMGLNLQGQALEKGANMALQYAQLGSQTMGQAASTEGAAANVTKLAADIETAKGSLNASSASILQAAGQLSLGAGSLNLSGGQLSQYQASQINEAARTIIGAQTTAAEYYSTQSSSILGMLQRGVNRHALAALFG